MNGKRDCPWTNTSKEEHNLVTFTSLFTPSDTEVVRTYFVHIFLPLLPSCTSIATIETKKKKKKKPLFSNKIESITWSPRFGNKVTHSCQVLLVCTLDEGLSDRQDAGPKRIALFTGHSHECFASINFSDLMDRERADGASPSGFFDFEHVSSHGDRRNERECTVSRSTYFRKRVFSTRKYSTMRRLETDALFPGSWNFSIYR